MFDAGLILEGGGMRGIFTAGVLDFFLDKDLRPKSVYGVSAGACHAASYLSRQRGRAYRISVDYLDDRRYCSVRSLLLTGDIFGVKMCYDTIPNELYPYDYDTYLKYEGEFRVVVTNCRTGQAEYLPVRDMRHDLAYIRASSSLPAVSRNVEIGGQEYLDGGISDSIPLARSIRDGNLKNIVVLTQHDGYRKGPNSLMPLIRMRYRKYPKLIEASENRHIIYNETLDFIAAEEAAGRAFVLRPGEPLELGRIEKDRRKLQEIYELGYSEARAAYPALAGFLGLPEIT